MSTFTATMQPVPANDSVISKRKLKAHTKSRAGCRNCKVRKVKCDETRPDCQRCRAYGVSCTYGGKDLMRSDYQTALDGGLGTGVLHLQRCSSVRTMLGMVNGTIDRYSRPSDDGTSGHFTLNVEDLNRLERFQSRTVLSLGSPITGRVYQEQIIKLVCQFPYLMHAVMSITCMHDRYLLYGRQSPRSFKESYHYGQVASLFRRTLSRVVPASEHDAIWATCVLLGCMSFFTCDATGPADAWPMKDSPTDLEWLQVVDGIYVVWTIVKPTRRGSAFERLSEDPSKKNLLASRRAVLRHGNEKLPVKLKQLCEVDDSSTVENNMYLSALQSLSPLLEMTCNHSTFLSFVGFSGDIEPGFKQLLHVKDPRALLILAYWYAKLAQGGPWFIVGRAKVECQAICMYLEKYHQYYGAIQELLWYPKSECGMVSTRRHPLTPTFMEKQSALSAV